MLVRIKPKLAPPFPNRGGDACTFWRGQASGDFNHAFYSRLVGFCILFANSKSMRLLLGYKKWCLFYPHKKVTTWFFVKRTCIY
jgi:hypothetical protein